MDIITYQTWIKKNPDVEKYYVRTVREVALPTLRVHKYIRAVNAKGYGLFNRNTPKELAIKLICEFYGHEWAKDKELVYFPVRRPDKKNGMDSLFVFYKRKKIS